MGLNKTLIFLLGYFYYSKTLHEKSLTERIDAITNQENFVPYNEISPTYINAVIAVEDHRYYKHGPIDIISIFRAMHSNIIHKEFKEGGSTITQQVCKNIIFNQDKSLIRKIAEVFAAFDLEKYYSKEEILALYANSSYFGDGYYGIYNASKGYFNKSPKDLNLNEASILAGVPNAPSIYSPNANPDLCKKRQKHVLNKMLNYGYISKESLNSIF